MSLQRAKDELGENEKDRINEVRSLRNLVLQEDWLRTPTGIYNFLEYNRRSLKLLLFLDSGVWRNL